MGDVPFFCIGQSFGIAVSENASRFVSSATIGEQKARGAPGTDPIVPVRGERVIGFDDDMVTLSNADKHGCVLVWVKRDEVGAYYL